jgi:hypothetical protein
VNGEGRPCGRPPSMRRPRAARSGPLRPRGSGDRCGHIGELETLEGNGSPGRVGRCAVGNDGGTIRTRSRSNALKLAALWMLRLSGSLGNHRPGRPRDRLRPGLEPGGFSVLAGICRRERPGMRFGCEHWRLV